MDNPVLPASGPHWSKDCAPMVLTAVTAQCLLAVEQKDLLPDDRDALD
jgi:hypothetical protein